MLFTQSHVVPRLLPVYDRPEGSTYAGSLCPMRGASNVGILQWAAFALGHPVGLAETFSENDFYFVPPFPHI